MIFKMTCFALIKFQIWKIFINISWISNFLGLKSHFIFFLSYFKNILYACLKIIQASEWWQLLWRFWMFRKHFKLISVWRWKKWFEFFLKTRKLVKIKENHFWTNFKHLKFNSNLSISCNRKVFTLFVWRLLCNRPKGC